MTLPALELRNVSYTFEHGRAPAVNGITLTVERGEWVAIVGASGSGKSALAQLISGYLPRAGGGSRTGRLLADGVDPAEAEIGEVAGRVGVVFQDPDAQLVQGRVEDEVAFGPENLRVPTADIERRVADALAAVALTERRRDRVHALSGGGRQRTAIAAVLALEPPILVLDEAAASLDAASRRRLLALLRRLHGEGRTRKRRN
ncbi:ABC transporter ATP-binding protein [Paenibacillus macerans]|uniref:ABC transporter ATP-binding protein n=1 Tax=Paenibacillus macerans TaxID=44252 RepID=UPI003D317901